MRRYFEQHEATNPLKPRDALFGGRNNAADTDSVIMLANPVSPNHLLVRIWVTLLTN